MTKEYEATGRITLREFDSPVELVMGDSIEVTGPGIMDSEVLSDHAELRELNLNERWLRRIRPVKP